MASHPTPPVFDGTEDRNGKRNHDEIRFWADYVSTQPARADYIYDDDGHNGGVEKNAAFVILGDLNADPHDGDSHPGAIQQLLDHPQINAKVVPSSQGGVDAAEQQGQANQQHEGDPAHDTADFSDRTGGNLRVDYALPSANLQVQSAGVYWPKSNESASKAANASDHRLVWVDLDIPKP